MINFNNIYIKQFLKKKLLRNILYECLNLLFYPFAFLILIFIKLLSPFLLIRWYNTTSTRIGHYVENMNIYLCEKELKLNNLKRKSLDIFYDRKIICNQQIKKMLNRNLLFVPWYIMNPINQLYELLFYKIFKKKEFHQLGYYRHVGKKEEFTIAPMTAFDQLNAQDNAKIQLKFCNDELKVGFDNLNSMGLEKNSNIVSIIIRDSDYLKNNYKNITWDHHRHRDTNLSFYIKAIDFLVRNGFKVIIFGNLNRKEFPEISNNCNVIFYSNSHFYSDFMDIFLLTRSKFVISSITGLDSVPIAFKIPVIEVGVIPFSLQRTYSNLFISLFKIYFSKTLNRNLTMSEIFENEIFDISGDSYLSNELEFIHPSNEEILKACEEMVQKLANNYNKNPKNILYQEKFKSMYNHYIKKYKPSRAPAVIKGSVAEYFLDKNLFLIN